MGYLKNELSTKSRYHISKERYLELKHHCLQYHEWRERLNELTELSVPDLAQTRTGHLSNETERVALEMANLRSKINRVENIANEASSEIGYYIFKAVTEGYSYPYLQTVLGIPCGSSFYYEHYRKFFWLLSME